MSSLKVVNYLLKRLELNYHRHIITDSYSCGTRRKLSTALSLIGHPQILLLVRTHLLLLLLPFLLLIKVSKRTRRIKNNVLGRFTL